MLFKSEVEQCVFDAISGNPVSRSARLLERLQSIIELPKRGRLLDVGCGNGALLQVFAAVAPLWSLAGTELNDQYRPVVESIQRVEALYTLELGKIPGLFNFITVVHVLEHVRDPRTFLSKLCDKLEVGGLLLIQVPDYLQNPFPLAQFNPSQSPNWQAFLKSLHARVLLFS